MSKYKPIHLLEENPHYFNFRGKPTMLITSAEHYAAVFNREFDYIKYLDALQAGGLNHTRTSTGLKRELPGTFNIDGNSQAPTPEAYMAPWMRTDVPGCLDGGNKYDLDILNEAYFERWRDFMRAADERGVEVELMLISEFHLMACGNSLWNVCPFNPKNCVNGIAPVDDPLKALSLENVDGTRYMDAFVVRLIEELNEFDNYHYEICNEPYYDDIPKDWMQHLADLIIETEKDMENQHLISQNIQAGLYEVGRDEPLNGVSILNFHYTSGDNIIRNYWFQGVLGLNETGIGLYNMLDYSFTVGKEDGTYEILPSSPGGGSPELRAKLKVLINFINSFEFWKMHPATGLLKTCGSPNVAYAMLAEEGEQYACYLLTHGHSGQSGQAPMCDLSIEAPPGEYVIDWLDAETGKHYLRQYTVRHTGGLLKLTCGDFSMEEMHEGEGISENCEFEIALSVKRKDE
jgi:hypothetical protein